MAMATYTKAQLVKSVLLKLGQVDANEAPEAEDFEDTAIAAQSKLEELYDDGLIPFDLDGEEIPARYLTSLAFLIAQPLMSDYAMTPEREARIERGAEAGLRTLRRLKQLPYYGAPVQATYY